MNGYSLEQKWQILSFPWPEASWKPGRKDTHTLRGRKINMVQKYLPVDLVLIKQSISKKLKKKNLGWRTQFLDIKSASSLSLNTCLTGVNYSKLATDLPHLEQIQPYYPQKQNMWLRISDDVKESLPPGNLKGTD